MCSLGYKVKRDSGCIIHRSDRMVSVRLSGSTRGSGRSQTVTILPSYYGRSVNGFDRSLGMWVVKYSHSTVGGLPPGAKRRTVHPNKRVHNRWCTYKTSILLRSLSVCGVLLPTTVVVVVVVVVEVVTFCDSTGVLPSVVNPQTFTTCRPGPRQFKS